MQYVLLFVAVALGVATAGAQELSLEEALRQADAHSPRLMAQRHAVAAAEHQTARAGELPDPRFKLGLENLPVTGPDRFRYGVDSMTAGVVGLAQEFPNAAKREARTLRAERLASSPAPSTSRSRSARSVRASRFAALGNSCASPTTPAVMESTP